jgi:squalene-hopene/tetraprenyl-beta-curcumene cyclase
LLDALQRAVDALISLQHDDGHLRGELEGDSILESEYILMKFILGQERTPMADAPLHAPGRDALRRIAKYMLSLQREDGGWGQYPGSATDLSATVKAYFALKLMGDNPDDAHMQRARNAIRELGGAEQCNSFTNFYLACLGQISWSAVPAIPPEIVFLPRWFYFHLTKVSAWTRTMILPLSLVATLRPTRPLPVALGIDELFIDRTRRHKLTNKVEAPRGWTAFFHGVDRLLKLAHWFGGTPIRRLAIKKAEQWILNRAGQDGPGCTDGLGAIFPPMVYLQIAFQALGYTRNHPVIARAERELDAFFLEDERGIRIQPCFSPVWDTGIGLYALTDAGCDIDDEPADRMAAWLRSKECRHVGDWADNLADPPEPGGWWFEYNNAWYPDVDDTAMVAMALHRAGGADNEAAARRGVRWLLSFQNADGGWAAFDRTTDRRILDYIPFADHNAMQDPSCPDITGRVLECLSWHGCTIDDEPVRRAIAYIKREQHEDGSFFGRWGVNYIYGTWQAVVGPIRCGVNRDAPWIRNAGRWLKSIQKPDGSFGESADSYIDPALKGKGPSTASQTAWAAMTMQEIFGAHDADVTRAIDWLVATQLTDEQAADPALNPDGDPPGSWVETEFTGTGFPRVFYLRYHLYRLYFPLMAIGRRLGAYGITLKAPGEVKLTPKIAAQRW